MKPGLYRNTLGAEIEVLWPISAVREFSTLGGIYEAVAHDDLFGDQPYLVTVDSMKSAGYELIHKAGSANAVDS